MPKYTIIEVQDWSDKDMWQVVYEVTLEDGTVTQSGHCFPKDIFEWRAAEYMIDPTDMDTLIDVVLAEAHLEATDYQPGQALHDAVDIDAARTAHLARCAQAKLKVRMSTRSTARSRLARLRAESHMDAEAIAVKRAHVQRVREHLSTERQAPRATGAERAAQLRAVLEPHRNIARRESV